MLYLRSREDVRRYYDLKRDPITTERMAQMLALFKNDVAELLPPAPVEIPPAAANELKGFNGACALGESYISSIETAEAARAEAAENDVRKAADALAAGKARQKPTQLEAAEQVTWAINDVLGCELLIVEAHGRLVQAMRDEWPNLHRVWSSEARSLMADVRDALDELDERVATTRAYGDAVAKIDSQMRSRFDDVRAAMEGEEAAGINLYAATHTGQGLLKTTSIKGVTNRGKPVGLPLSDVLEGIRQTLSSSRLDAGHYVVPDDPGHGAWVEDPFGDLSAAWIRSAVGRAQGGMFCKVCAKDGADVVVEAGSGLALAHSRCLNRELTDFEKKQQRIRERRQPWLRSGFPSEGSVLDDALRQERDEERERNEREDAQASARGALSDGDANAEQVARRQKR